VAALPASFQPSNAAIITVCRVPSVAFSVIAPAYAAGPDDGGAGSRVA
jgi:hypothetical protein